MTDKTVKLPELAEIEKALRCLYLEAHRSVISGPWNTMLLIRRAERIIDDMRMLVGEIADLQAKLAQREAATKDAANKSAIEICQTYVVQKPPGIHLAIYANTKQQTIAIIIEENLKKVTATPQSGDTPERKEG